MRKQEGSGGKAKFAWQIRAIGKEGKHFLISHSPTHNTKTGTPQHDREELEYYTRQPGCLPAKVSWSRGKFTRKGGK